jgi:alpha-1,2-mannosyltransferase
MQRIYLYSAASLLLALLMQVTVIAQNMQPFGHDFYAFWSAGRLALEQGFAAPYNPALLKAIQLRELPVDTGYLNYWLYPPLLLYWIALFLALFPYYMALAIFITASCGVFYALFRKENMLLIFGFPAFLICLLNGQNGVISAALMIGALRAMKEKPALAGILFGLLAYKPQLCFAIPIALLAAREWRVMFYGVLTLLISAPLMGLAPWVAFFESIQIAFQVNSGLVEPWKSATFTSALKHMGLNLPYVQHLISIIVAFMLYQIWRGRDTKAKHASLILATLLIAPHVMDYDYVMTALVVVYYRQNPLVILLWFAPWIARPLLQHGYIPLLYLTSCVIFMQLYHAHFKAASAANIRD